MNEYGHCNTKKITRESAPRKHGNNSVLRVVGCIILLIVIFAGASGLRLFYNEKLMELTRKKDDLEQSIQEKKHAITEMRNRKETLSEWNYVKSKIEQYRLGMVVLDSNKVTYLTRCSIDEYKTGTGHTGSYETIAGVTPSTEPSEIAMMLQKSAPDYK